MNREQYTRVDLATDPDQNWYRRIVDPIRAYSCPEKFECPATSRYPNIAAEMHAIGFNVYIGDVAKAARVQARTIAFAIESGARLYPYQLERLAAVFNVSVEYLSDPYMAVVDPLTDVGANQVARLGALLEETKGLDVPYIARIRDGYGKLCEGNRITYAAYKAYIRLLLSTKRHPRLSRLRSEGKVLYIGYLPIGIEEAVQA